MELDVEDLCTFRLVKALASIAASDSSITQTVLAGSNA